MTDLVMTAGLSDVADLVVRATVVLLVALALQWLTHRGPALTRHNLWTLTFALLLVLPGLRLFGPSWDVPVLPQAQAPVEGEPIEALVQGDPASVSLVSITIDTAEAGWRAGTGPPSLPLVLWGFGAAAALFSSGVGAWRFHRLVRAARPVEDPAWLGHLYALRQRLAVHAEVRLGLAPEAPTPLTGGLLNPVILLPASAVTWSEERRHIVLVHELVHVRRRDTLRQLLGRAALALYWFHPLSWVASHLAAARREEACDEEVLAAGTRPSRYAGHLLALAESGFLRRPSLSVPLVRQSRLEGRTRAILKPHRARPRALVAVAALMAATVGGLSVSVANPTRTEVAPGGTGEAAAAVGAATVDCVPASDAGESSSWESAEGLDGVLVCTVQGEALTTAGSNEVRSLGGLYRPLPESMTAKPFERRNAGLP